MLNIFSKITRKTIILEKIERSEAGLYFYLIFPMAIAFLITFITARIISFFIPSFGIFLGDIRIHHFVWGIFVLAFSGYLALIFTGPRSKYLIALLHGFGLGLSFDEFAFWLKLTDDDLARWSFDGFIIVMALFLLLISAKRGLKMLSVLWPFRG